jgi:Rad3-related DNA helicase
MWCDEKWACPYEQAKTTTLAADLAVLNLSYLLTEANGPGRFGADGENRSLVILDEADLVESALLGFVEVEFGPYWQNKIGIGLPRLRTHGAKSNDWAEWAEEAASAARRLKTSLPPRVDTVPEIRFKSRLNNLIDKLDMLSVGLEEGQWVMQIDQRGRGDTAVFKPVKVDHFADRMLWRHGQRFLLMSGSVISAEEMADSLGIENYELVTVPMEWPAEQRPIFSVPVTAVSHRNKAQSWPKLVTALGNILARHPSGRVLVHTVSYKLAQYVAEHLQTDRPVLMYTSAAERELTLSRYRATPDAVLLASSMDRGVDLPDDACDVQVILKVPFPNLGDKQVSQRLNATGRSGKTWYAVQTARTILQMVGRGMRHKDDRVVTYIVDKAFEDNVLARRRRLFPGYFLDALVQDRELTREIAAE